MRPMDSLSLPTDYNQMMNKKHQILVTGGTGFLGSYLLRKLLMDGYTQIRALKRATSDLALVQDLQDQIEWIDCDVLDVLGLEDAMKGVHQVYHCAAVISFNPRDQRQMKKINTEGTANVVNAALIENIDKLVYVSSISAIGRSEKRPNIDEKVKWEASTLNTAYAKSKYHSEKEVWRGIAEGLNAVIINPSVILGSGFWRSGSTRLFYEIWKGLKFFPKGGTGFVDVRDVATLMIKMMESDISGERFIANGANLSYKDFFEQIASAIQKNPPTIPVTPFLRAIAWRAAWLKATLTGKKPFITKETAMISSKSFVFDNSKSTQFFHFDYRPIEQTISATATQMVEAAGKKFKPLLLEF